MLNRSDRPFFETAVFTVFGALEMLLGLVVAVVVVWFLASMFSGKLLLPGARTMYFNQLGECRPGTVQGPEQPSWIDSSGLEPCNQPYYGIYQTATE